MTEHNKPIAYREAGRIHLRMSAFGNCVKSLSASLAGMEPAPPPQFLQAAFAEGHKWEDAILNHCEDHYQGIVEARQGTATLRVSKEFVLVGHPDGKLTAPSFDAVVDAKNLHPTRVRSLEIGGLPEMGPLGIKYATQGLLYCHAWNENNFILSVRNKESGEIAHHEYSVDDLEDITGLSKGKIRSKCFEVKKGALSGDLLSLECAEPSFGCPYFFLHTDQGLDPFWDGAEEMTPAEEEVMSGLVWADVKAKEQVKMAEAAQKAARQALLGFLEVQSPMPEELNEDTKDKVKFTYVLPDGTKVMRLQSSGSSLNQQAMKEDGIDVDSYKNRYFYSQVRITQPKEDS